MQSYIEKLRFTILLKNLTKENQQNPTILLGINEIKKTSECVLQSGNNEIIFDDVVLHSGMQNLIIEVKETENALLTGAFVINDLKIHNTSIDAKIFQSVYYPKYDQEYYEKNKSCLPTEIRSGLYIGNRGRWIWTFTAPIFDNPSYKIGLW